MDHYLMITVSGLTKQYGHTVVVDDIAFEIAPGRVTGFVGPNGAGKSTTMRMMVGLTRPDQGVVSYDGMAYPSLLHPARVVGSVLDAWCMHPGRTARNHLRAIAALSAIPRCKRMAGQVLPQGVGKSQQSSIEDSFGLLAPTPRSRGTSCAAGYCASGAAGTTMTKWWASFQQRHSDTSVQIELWDENRLRELLLRDTSANIRRAYYNPYRETISPNTYVPNARRPGRPLTGTWRGGDERIFHDTRYLLHETPSQTHTADRSLVQRVSEATDLRDGQRVWDRQAQSTRYTSAALAVRQALRMQAALDLISPVVDLIDEDDATTLITEHPDGTSWEQAFRTVPVDPLTALAVLDAAADVCQALGRLHRREYDHRLIDPTTVVVGAGSARLRDAGLMAVPASPLDASTRNPAPEQFRAPYTAGPPTDVYQLAALVQHALTRHLPLGRPCRSRYRCSSGLPGRCCCRHHPGAVGRSTGPAGRPCPRDGVAPGSHGNEHEGGTVKRDTLNLPGPIVLVPSQKIAADPQRHGTTDRVPLNQVLTDCVAWPQAGCWPLASVRTSSN